MKTTVFFKAQGAQDAPNQPGVFDEACGRGRLKYVDLAGVDYRAI
jgi:hypothetical protein